MHTRPFKIFTFIALALLLQACGTLNVRPGTAPANLNQYSKGFIEEIDISSREQNGDSLDANSRMKSYAQQQLEALIKKSPHELVPANSNNGTLAFHLDIDIIYGSRAARYWNGLSGAGRGSVNSTLKVVDKKSGETIYTSTAASTLKMGFFGGSMESVIKTNIDKLLSTYPASTI